MNARRLAPWLFVVPLAVSACPGNGDSSASDGAAGDSAAYVDGGDFCNTFFEGGGAGTPCPHASPVRCFPQCTTGGCYCTASSSGPVWQCQTDFSCMPDCGPLDDCGPAPVDAGTADAASDAPPG